MRFISKREGEKVEMTGNTLRYKVPSEIATTVSETASVSLNSEG